MPTITINLPDSESIPVNWDAKSFFATKMYEAGILSSEHVAITVGVSPSVFVGVAKEYAPVEPESDSWFTPEQHAQFRENRRRLEEEWASDPETEKKQEELYQLLLNGPVADEETYYGQSEIKDALDTEADSWFTPEQIARCRENRRRLEEKWTNDPNTEKKQEEFYQLLLNGPVATEEEIRTLEEIQEMRRQWKSPWQ